MSRDERAPELPDRPSLPVTFWMLVATIAVERAVLSGAVPAGACVAVLAVTCLVAAIIYVALTCGISQPAVQFDSFQTKRKAGSRGIALLACAVLACAAAGAGVAALTLRSGESLVTGLSHGSVQTWEFRVTSDPKASDSAWGASTWRCRAQATRDGSATGEAWLLLPTQVRLGDVVTCVGTFDAGDDGDEWTTSNRMRGTWGTVRAVRVTGVRAPDGPASWVLALRRAALARIDPHSSRERALLAGCVCGYSAAMADFGDDDLFALCGVSHLVAVSGSHLALLMGLVEGVLLRARVRPRRRAVAQVVLGAVFVAFCGAPVSAVRSWLMTASAVAARQAGRRSYALSAVCLMALAMALVRPTVTGQLGYLLSVGSVAGLCMLTRYMDYVLATLVPVGRALRDVPRPVRRRTLAVTDELRQMLAVTLAAQLATTPVCLLAFGLLSLVAPIANLVVVPVFGAVMAVGLGVVVTCAAPVASGVLLAVTDVLCHVVLAVLDVLAKVPHAAVALEVGPWVMAVQAAALAVLLVWWPKVHPRKVACVLAVSCALTAAVLVRWRYLAPARVRVLDVGQGDAILVQDGAHAILVDTGPPGDALALALTRGHVLHLDAVVITHLHDDHYGGLEELTGLVDVDEVIVADGVADDLAELGLALPTGAEVEELAYGDVLGVGGFELACVWPQGEVDGSKNADSLMLVATYDEGGRELCALLTGDAEKDELACVIAAGDVGDVDLLKVGHHGSAVSLTADEARALAAEVAVASAGRDNDYGHPTDACVEVLEGAGALFLCTKDVGDVTVEPAADGVTVTCAHPVDESY